MRRDALLLGLALAGCATKSEEGTRAVPVAPAPAVATPAATSPAAPAPAVAANDGTLRLLDRLDAWTIASPWDPLAAGAPERELAPSFALDFEGSWPAELRDERLAVPFPGTPPMRAGAALPPEPPARLAAEAAADGAAGLRFDHASGCALVILPLHPDTPYVFTTRVRRGIDPASCAAGGDEAVRARAAAELARHAAAGSVVLLELNELPAGEASLASLLDSFAQRTNALVTTHVLSSPAATGEWSQPRLEWKSSVFTHALAVALVAGNPGWWRLEASGREQDAPPDGAVDFDDVRLFELPLARWLSTAAAVAHDDLPCDAPRIATPPVAPRERAFVRKVHLLADARRALLAPPGTKASAPITLPRGKCRLSFSFGVLEERRPGFGGAPVEFVATLAREGAAGGGGGATAEPVVLVRASVQAAASAAASAWQEFSLELDGAGERAHLAFETIGDAARGEMAAFGEPKVEPLLPEAERPWNVVLVSLDTLRADRLGCQGYARADGEETTPNLDAFAAESLRFANARSVAPFTLPSHATMFTGLSPRVHRVTRSGRRLTSGIHPLLVEEFAAAGYATGAFTGGAFVAYEHGFHHGFDRYSILDPFLTVEDPYREVFPHPGERAWNDAAYAHDDRRAIERWVDGQAGRPFFLFVHSYVAHNYHPPAAIERRFVRGDAAAVLGPTRDLKWLDATVAAAGGRIAPEVARVASDVYDAAVAAVDADVGALLGFLRERGLLDRTVVAVVSDHGEEFGEHGGLLHGRTLHEELLRVPFLLRVPRLAPAVVDEPVDLADLAPTLRDAVGLPPQPGDGRSVLARVRDDGFADSFWAEVTAPGLSRRYALLAGRLKLIHAPPTRYEEADYAARRPAERTLFDLGADPRELRPLLASSGEAAAAALARMEREMTLRRAELDERRRMLLPDAHALEYSASADAKQLLRAVGYVSGSEAPAIPQDAAADGDEEE